MKSNLNKIILNFSIIFILSSCHTFEHKNIFLETSELKIPHPGSLYRKFVLIPLAELIPNEIFPKTNIKIVDLLEKCPDTSVVEKYIIDKKA